MYCIPSRHISCRSHKHAPTYTQANHYNRTAENEMWIELQLREEHIHYVLCLHYRSSPKKPIGSALFYLRLLFLCSTINLCVRVRVHLCMASMSVLVHIRKRSHFTSCLSDCRDFSIISALNFLKRRFAANRERKPLRNKTVSQKQNHMSRNSENFAMNQSRLCIAKQKK